jgi:peptidyl-prolyl cis-trans isomerase D
MRSAGKYIMGILFIAFVGGYLLVDTAGLLGVQPVTQGTVVGKVNGTEITYVAWLNATNNLVAERESQQGRTLDLDERAQLEEQAFEDMILEALLSGEYKRRGIRVTDEEIVDAARFSPPPALMQSPDLQTDGQFDPAKWQRFLSSPSARQQGVLSQLEAYYRTELPRLKLYQQIAGEAYVSDWRLWQIYADQNDSATVSYVAFRPAAGADSAQFSNVTDAEISAYYNNNKEQITSVTSATVSALVIPRTPSAFDSADTRARLLALRDRIAKGEKFEDVAREASDDSVSGTDGGSLGRGGRGRFVPEFEDALYNLRQGELSQPVSTQFGLHLIRVDERKGDTISARHILLRVRQSDSSATATDRLADQVARLAAAAEDGSKLDSAAAAVGIPLIPLNIVQGRRTIAPSGAVLAGLTQWATGSGARVGEVSDLLDGDDAYFIVRLDSLKEGGPQPLSAVKEDIRRFLATKKAVAALAPTAKQLASAAAGSSLEQAATAAGKTVEKAGPFSRTGFVPGIGQLSPVTGAAYALAVGAVSEPIVADDGVYVIRVDARQPASRDAFTAQLPTQRAQFTERLQQERVRQYLSALRQGADVDDRRRKVLGSLRAQSAAADNLPPQ